jgi:ribosome recycling factor
MYKYQDKVQKITDEFIEKIDAIEKEKETEILEF